MTVLSVVSTNDLHGHVETLPLLAGFLSNLRQHRSKDGAVLLLDGGDALHGTLASAIDEGSIVIRTYGAIGYHAATIGNHEFDFGPMGPASTLGAAGADPHGALKARLAEAPFPFLSSNLTATGGRELRWDNLRRSVSIRIADIEIGVIGGITEETPKIVKPPNFVGLRVNPLAPAVISEAETLRQRGAEVVIALVHAGGRCERFDDPHDLSSCDPDTEVFALARSLPEDLVDLIVGGHRSSAVAHFVEGTPIVHAYSAGVALSRVDLVFDHQRKRVVERVVHPPRFLCGRRSAIRCEPGSYAGAPVTEDRHVHNIVAEALGDAEDVQNQELGVALSDTLVAKKRAECAMGNLFVDLMRRSVPSADAALSNGGSLRSDLPSGRITLRQLHQAMPFDNLLAVVHLTGEQLSRVIAANVSQSRHGIVSVSGIRARVRCADDSLKVDLFRESGSPIEHDERLVVVTSDFLALGGDGLMSDLDLAPEQIELDTGFNVRSVLIQGMKQLGEEVRCDDPNLFDPQRPRIDLPGPLPVSCDR